MRLLIVGGTGKFGRWFVPLFRRHGWEVMVSGRGERREVADSLGCRYVPADEYPKTLKECDMVMISVPIDVFEDVVRKVAPHMRKGSILFDVTSIKKEPIEAMLKYAPEGVEVVGTHPMFGPTVPNLKGQTVIMVRTPKSGKGFDMLKSLFESEGAHVEVMGAEEHDRVMAVVQGLTHFAYISIGATLKKLGFDVAKSRKCMSPVYEVMIDFVGRILAQNPYLYALIQTNPETIEVRKVFLEEARRLSELIERNDIEGFVKTMKESASHFGNTEAALRRSDKIIRRTIDELENVMSSIGKEVIVQHVKGTYHRGILVDVKGRELIIREGKRTGIFKLENIRILEPHEVMEWRMKNVPRVRRDFSFFVPEGASEDVLRWVISNVENVADVSLIDVYNHEKGRSITFRVEILSDVDVKSIEHEIIRILKGLGCSIRGE
ncbi:prephenate dehydrogenase [Methanosarcinales archaeon]|nr:MAG: prephenate dehydrogenase [Methanosarcinales archaeon]